MELELQFLKNLKNRCLRINAGMNFVLFINSFLFRFAVYELEYATSYGTTEYKIVLVLYAPDICGTTEKFMYATSKDALKKKLPYLNKDI